MSAATFKSNDQSLATLLAGGGLIDLHAGYAWDAQGEILRDAEVTFYPELIGNSQFRLGRTIAGQVAWADTLLGTQIPDLERDLLPLLDTPNQVFPLLGNLLASQIGPETFLSARPSLVVSLRLRYPFVGAGSVGTTQVELIEPAAYGPNVAACWMSHAPEAGSPFILKYKPRIEALDSLPKPLPDQAFLDGLVRILAEEEVMSGVDEILERLRALIGGHVASVCSRPA